MYLANSHNDPQQHQTVFHHPLPSYHQPIGQRADEIDHYFSNDVESVTLTPSEAPSRGNYTSQLMFHHRDSGFGEVLSPPQGQPTSSGLTRYYETLPLPPPPPLQKSAAFESPRHESVNPEFLARYSYCSLPYRDVQGDPADESNQFSLTFPTPEERSHAGGGGGFVGLEPERVSSRISPTKDEDTIKKGWFTGYFQ